MFRKRERKIFPPGTFIATPIRIVAIIHLCLAFALLLWIASQPFMGDLYSVKSEMLLYEAVLNKPSLMQQLPTNQIEKIKSDYTALISNLHHSFIKKMSMMFTLFVQLPALEQAWLYFSLALPILLLLKIEGAIEACCLLPIIAFAYGCDNTLNGAYAVTAPDQALFPTEQTLIVEYLDTPLTSSISQQQVELTRGWQRYLIETWAKESPASNPEVFTQQVEKGEFAFNIARLALRNKINLLAIDIPATKKSNFILGLYLLWNTFFAWMVMRRRASSSTARMA